MIRNLEAKKFEFADEEAALLKVRGKKPNLPVSCNITPTTALFLAQKAVLLEVSLKHDEDLLLTEEERMSAHLLVEETFDMVAPYVLGGPTLFPNDDELRMARIAVHPYDVRK